MSLRTDLIAEKREFFTSEIEGVSSKEQKLDECMISEIDIESDTAAKALEKPKGKYFTISFPRLDTMPDTSNIKTAILYALKRLIPASKSKMMIVGLGNTDITPDALGPFCADKIIATRHLGDDIKSALRLEDLRETSCLIPGVLGKTGIEASLIIAATADKTKPDTIIAIDALAAADKGRLCTTIQLSNTGISPGSGVKNRRKELSETTLGIPVIAIGMPTVAQMEAGNDDFMVTPKEIDLLITVASEIISDALNRFLQPDIDEEIIEALA